MKPENFKPWEKYTNYMDSMKEKHPKNDEALMALELIKSNSNVLSCGCGPGREVRFLIKNKNCKVTAIDISKRMIKESKKIEPKAKYLLMDFSNYSSKGKFDCVVCLWNTINLLSFEDRIKFIKNSQKNLKKDGKLIITSANMFSNWRVVIKWILNRGRVRELYYNPIEIKKWFKDSNFNYSIIKSFKGNWIIIAEKSTLTVRGCING